MIDYRELARRVWHAYEVGKDEEWYNGFIEALSVVTIIEDISIQDIRTDKAEVIFYLTDEIKISISLGGVENE